MAELELLANETILETVSGDYWEHYMLWMDKQISGKFTFTNKRILFDVGIIKKFSTKGYLDLAVTDIESLATCNVGMIIPTGIRVTMKDGKKHKLSVLKRGKYIKLLKELMGEPA